MSGTSLLNELVGLGRVEPRIDRLEPAGEVDQLGDREPVFDGGLEHEFDAEPIGVTHVPLERQFGHDAGVSSIVSWPSIAGASRAGPEPNPMVIAPLVVAGVRRRPRDLRLSGVLACRLRGGRGIAGRTPSG